MEGWNAAAAAWDSAALTNLYTADALFFGGRQRHFIGRDGVRAYFDSYRDMLAAVALTMQDQHVKRIAPESVMAIVVGYKVSRPSDLDTTCVGKAPQI